MEAYLEQICWSFSFKRVFKREKRYIRFGYVGLKDALDGI